MKQILIISTHAMFSHGLESLLRKETNCQIIAQEDDISRAAEQIEALQPDIVILDTDDPVQNSLPHILRILATTATIKIVCLSLQNNDIHICQVKHWVARKVSDLVEAINEPVSAA